jgi:hypothetical protein
MMANILLIFLAIYLLCGIVFAIPFTLGWARRIDPHAKTGSWGFRLLIIPGVSLLWPILAKRLLSGRQEPIEENNSHRSASKKAGIK